MKSPPAMEIRLRYKIAAGGFVGSSDEVNIVLNHFGGPLGVGPYRRDEVFPGWRADINELAICPNVCVKLGGLAMIVDAFDFHLASLPPSSGELANAWRPYVETCLEAFGANRCMFESNFPVDKGACSYPVVQCVQATGERCLDVGKKRAVRQHRGELLSVSNIAR